MQKQQLKDVARKLDLNWVEEELIPLLIVAYGEPECGQWIKSVQAVTETVYELVSVTHFTRVALDIVTDLSSLSTRTSIPPSSASVCFW
jgi:hypothetical protein